MDGGVTRSLYIGRDKTLEVRKRREAVERELQAKREAKIREQHERVERAAQLKVTELRDRTRQKHQRELERQKAVLDRRYAYMEQQNARKTELLKRAHQNSSRIATSNQSKKLVYAFGSSTPRKLPFLENQQQQQRDSGSRNNFSVSMRASTPSLPQGSSTQQPIKHNPNAIKKQSQQPIKQTQNVIKKQPQQPIKQTPNSIEKQRKIVKEDSTGSNNQLIENKEVYEKQNSHSTDVTCTATNNTKEGSNGSDNQLIENEQLTENEDLYEKQNSHSTDVTCTATNTSFYTALESSYNGEVSILEPVLLSESEPIITPPKSTTPPIPNVTPKQEDSEERSRRVREVLARTRQDVTCLPNLEEHEDRSRRINEVLARLRQDVTGTPNSASNGTTNQC